MTWSNDRQRPYAQRKGRALVLERAGHRCQIKGPHCTGVGNFDDHILPLASGGSNDLSNRQAACKSCHDEKTAREASAAAKKVLEKARRPQSKHPGLK